MSTPTASPSAFLDYLLSLAPANDATLVHMVLAHDEGSIPGDAAFSALASRTGIKGAHAAVTTERTARELESWTMKMEAFAQVAMAA
ncbi:MAG TPA: hypothetical protein VM221_06045 [Armatimonadota bacterium]|nr:hypothetical protein [Armatimonadota bacterium]